MNPNEFSYRRTVGSVGGGLLLFLSLFYGLDILGEVILLPFAFSSVSEETYEIAGAVVGGLSYLFAFLLPAPIIRAFLKKRKLLPRPVKSAPSVSPWLPVIVFACVFLNLSSAYLNNWFTELLQITPVEFDYSDVSVSVGMPAYLIVLYFLTDCVVPAFCEEYLFRGVILGNFRPFGRTPAILISALLFAMMHQNYAQFFYTFTAGILLGVLYDVTGSIWNGVIVHLFVNFSDLCSDVIFSFFRRAFEGFGFMLLFELILVFLGVISVGVVALLLSRKKSSFQNGVFGKEISPSGEHTEKPLPSGRAVKLFFTPCMTIYLCFCGGIILFQIGVALWNGIGIFG